MSLTVVSTLMNQSGERELAQTNLLVPDIQMGSPAPPLKLYHINTSGLKASDTSKLSSIHNLGWNPMQTFLEFNGTDFFLLFNKQHLDCNALEEGLKILPQGWKNI